MEQPQAPGPFLFLLQKLSESAETLALVLVAIALADVFGELNADINIDKDTVAVVSPESSPSFSCTHFRSMTAQSQIRVATCLCSPGDPCPYIGGTDMEWCTAISLAKKKKTPTKNKEGKIKYVMVYGKVILSFDSFSIL